MNVISRLEDVLNSIGPAAIAVSGGVDSMTLAYVAAKVSSSFQIYHAVSDAVPSKASKRVQHYAQKEGWNLHLIDAGEFKNPQYRENPINRCYFCKSNLYGEISKHTGLTILSGTNLDDLDDYRPGLIAARESYVRHPFVEACINKDAIREIARAYGLKDLSELPAAPCLSSRVETGIRIEALDLNLIDTIENDLNDQFGNIAVRCRIRKSGLCIELDDKTLATLSPREIDLLIAKVQNKIHPRAYAVSVEPYIQGSAFVGMKTNG